MAVRVQPGTAHASTKSGEPTYGDAKERKVNPRERKRLVIMSRYAIAVALIVILLAFFLWPEGAHAQAANMQGVVDTLLAKYQNAGQTWTRSIQDAATKFFWLLAPISLAWTCVAMGIKQADLVEIVAELCRFIMFTGFFFWLLLNGPTFANAIINSLRQIGGDAAGTGQAIFPGKLINLGMQVYQQTLQHVNWLQPESMAAVAAKLRPPNRLWSGRCRRMKRGDSARTGTAAQTISRTRQPATRRRNITGGCMGTGETVVFVNDVQGVEAGRHGRVMGLCDDTVMVGCRVRERLQCVLAHTWDVLPERMWRRLLKRRQITEREGRGGQQPMNGAYSEGTGEPPAGRKEVARGIS